MRSTQTPLPGPPPASLRSCLSPLYSLAILRLGRGPARAVDKNLHPQQIITLLIIITIIKQKLSICVRTWKLVLMMISNRSHQKRQLCPKRQQILPMKCRQVSSRTSRPFPREATRITETGMSTTKLSQRRPTARQIKPLMSSMARGACAAPAAPNKHKM